MGVSESSLQQLRPLALGEILDVSMKIVWRNAATLLRIVVFVVLPVQLIAAVAELSALPSDWTASSFPTRFQEPSNQLLVTQHDQWAANAATFLSTLLSIVATAIAAGACYRAIASAYLGERTSWRSSLGFALRRFHSILWVTIISTVCALLALVACIVPGVYLWACWAVAVPVLLTEDRRGFKALRRSRALVKGNWWRTFGVTLLAFILAGVVSAVIEGIAIGVLFTGTTLGTWVFVNAVAGTIARIVTTPFTAAIAIVLYFDLRVRKEAFDLQLLANRIGVDPTGELPFALGTPPPASRPEAPPFWPPPPGWRPGGGDGSG